MKIKWYSITIILVLCFQMPGCGKTETSNSVLTDSSVSSVLPNLSNSNTISPQISSNPSSENYTEPAITNKSDEEKNIENVKISPIQPYSDINRKVSVIGLKEYKKIKGEIYTDKPKKGNRYLVLFLEIANTTNTEDYINYNYISAKVDGEKIEHTFLVNEPKGYPTIFTHISANKKIRGFIVWEVPYNWKKFNFVYNGWKDTNNISMSAEFTQADLSDPVIYNANELN